MFGTTGARFLIAGFSLFAKLDVGLQLRNRARLVA